MKESFKSILFETKIINIIVSLVGFCFTGLLVYGAVNLIDNSSALYQSGVLAIIPIILSAISAGLTLCNFGTNSLLSKISAFIIWGLVCTCSIVWLIVGNVDDAMTQCLTVICLSTGLGSLVSLFMFLVDLGDAIVKKLNQLVFGAKYM